MILLALTGTPKHVRDSLPTVTIAPVLHRERTKMWVWEWGRQELCRAIPVSWGFGQFCSVGSCAFRTWRVPVFSVWDGFKSSLVALIWDKLGKREHVKGDGRLERQTDSIKMRAGSFLRDKGKLQKNPLNPEKTWAAAVSKTDCFYTHSGNPFLCKANWSAHKSEFTPSQQLVLGSAKVRSPSQARSTNYTRQGKNLHKYGLQLKVRGRNLIGIMAISSWISSFLFFLY